MVVAANGNSQPDDAIRDEKMLEADPGRSTGPARTPGIRT